MSAGVALTVAGGMTASADDTFLIAQAPPPPTTRTPSGMDTGTGGMPQTQTFGAPQQTFGAPVQTFGAPQQEFTQPGVQAPVAQVPAGYVPPPPQQLGFGPGAGGGGFTAETTMGPMGAQPGGMQPFDIQTMAPQPVTPQAMQPFAPQPMSPMTPQTASAPVEDFPMVAKSWGGIVRSQPTMDSNKIASLAEGQEMTLMARVEGPLFNDYAWFRINYGDNKSGYQWGGIICGIGRPINGALGVCK